MKKYKYSFAPDQNSKGGIQAVILSGISLFLLLLTALISGAFQGKGGNYLGAFGLFSFLTASYGFLLGIKSFSEKNVNHRYSMIGSLLGGILAVLWLGIFLTGIS